MCFLPPGNCSGSRCTCSHTKVQEVAAKSSLTIYALGEKLPILRTAFLNLLGVTRHGVMYLLLCYMLAAHTNFQQEFLWGSILPEHWLSHLILICLGALQGLVTRVLALALDE